MFILLHDEAHTLTTMASKYEVALKQLNTLQRHAVRGIQTGREKVSPRDNVSKWLTALKLNVSQVSPSGEATY